MRQAPIRRVAFVGLGQMGMPMARNLIRAAPELMVTSASERAFPELRSLGATATRDLAALAEADLVFLSLPGGDQVQEVLFGPAGLASRLRAGSVVVDTSTIGHALTLRIDLELKDLGIDFVDAPVSGMESRAIEGTLTAMCGGAADVIDLVRPYLGTMASSILHMGRVGSGQLAKLINQLLFDVNCAALAELLPMGVKLGLDAEALGMIVNQGTGRSYASEFFVPRVLERNFNDGYPLEHAYKDLIHGAEVGTREQIPLPVLAAATATYQSALLQGLGARDKGAMIQVFERLLGVEFSRSST